MTETLTEQDEAQAIREIRIAIDKAWAEGIPLITGAWGLDVQDDGTMVARQKEVGICPLSCVLLGLTYESDVFEDETIQEVFYPDREVPYVLFVPKAWVDGFVYGYDDYTVEEAMKELDGFASDPNWQRGYEIGQQFRRDYPPKEAPTDWKLGLNT